MSKTKRFIELIKSGQLIKIQGGMALKSSFNLAGPVARTGWVGVIAITAHARKDIQDMIYPAREICGPDGILGVNIMAADKFMKEHLVAALETGEIDVVIQGAGISIDAPRLCKAYGVPYVPIISKPKQVPWYLSKFDIAAFIYEGKEAGGHLGDLERSLFVPGDDTLEQMVALAGKTPVIAAGGITPERVSEIITRGAKGIQIATPFLVTAECGLPDNVKQLYANAKASDVVLMNSSAGLPGRALRSPLTEALARNERFPAEYFGQKCVGCLKACKHRDKTATKVGEDFCVRGALMIAKEGDLERGLFFIGEAPTNWPKDTTVKQVTNEYNHKG